MHHKVQPYAHVVRTTKKNYYQCNTNWTIFNLLSVAKMPNSGSEVSDDFEFIETPAAPTPAPPPEDYGVRTTTVSANNCPSSN